MEFELVGGMCYLLMEEMFNWTYSSQLCREKGASLVVIETETQQKHVESLMKKYLNGEIITYMYASHVLFIQILQINPYTLWSKGWERIPLK